ncbi:MAG: hypothetical protein RR651_06155 [Lysinibacillus sp.]
MSKKQELMDAITQNPERRLVVMYDSESGNSDYAYTLGKIQKVKVTEMTSYNDERIYYSDEYDDLFETIEDDVHTELHGIKTVNNDEIAEIKRLAKVIIEKYKWEPVIVVYVGS